MDMIKGEKIILKYKYENKIKVISGKVLDLTKDFIVFKEQLIPKKNIIAIL